MDLVEVPTVLVEAGVPPQGQAAAVVAGSDSARGPDRNRIYILVHGRRPRGIFTHNNIWAAEVQGVHPAAAACPQHGRVFIAESHGRHLRAIGATSHSVPIVIASCADVGHNAAKWAPTSRVNAAKSCVDLPRRVSHSRTALSSDPLARRPSRAHASTHSTAPRWPTYLLAVKAIAEKGAPYGLPKAAPLY